MKKLFSIIVNDDAYNFLWYENKLYVGRNTFFTDSHGSFESDLNTLIDKLKNYLKDKKGFNSYGDPLYIDELYYGDEYKTVHESGNVSFYLNGEFYIKKEDAEQLVKELIIRFETIRENYELFDRL